jgi:heme a synthase
VTRSKTNAGRAAPSAGVRQRRAPDAPVNENYDNRTVAIWLLAVAAMVFFMVLLGGLTRLTHSGLSMVEWRPLTGWLPPLSEAAWEADFAKYKQFPEFQQINFDMTLDGYKQIYWLEYLHRLFGRLIGLAFAIPFFVFVIRRRIDPRFAPRLGLIFLLGAMQGAVGWFMVASGLVDRPDVSHYRLTAHLGLAVLIYGMLVWTALELLLGGRRQVSWRGMALPALVFLQSLLGALVAGLDAGFAYNTWPTMDGDVLPEGLFNLAPWWLNFLDNLTMVQFQHRLVAYGLVVAAVIAWRRARQPGAGKPVRDAGNLLLAAVAAQTALGILTLIFAVPVSLGVLHQAGALLLLTAALYLAYCRAPKLVSVLK